MMNDHKNDISKDDIQNLYKDINFMSSDITQLRNKMSDMVCSKYPIDVNFHDHS